MWNVLVVEPEPIYREGLRAILAAEADFTIAGEASDGAGAYERAAALRPDVISIEVELSGQSGLTVATELIRRMPATQILVLTSRMDEPHVVEALSAGVHGYVGKEQPISEVLRALRLVGAGQTYLAPSISRYVLDQYVRMSRTGQTGPLLALTPRERDIFELTVRGVATQEIGARLNISRRTVDTHRTRILRKLDVHSTADLVRLAARLGVLSSDPPGGAPQRWSAGWGEATSGASPAPGG